MPERVSGECRLSGMLQPGGAPAFVRGKTVFKEPFVIYTCGETLVALQDSYLERELAHCCHGKDHSLWLMFQLKGVSLARIKEQTIRLEPGSMVGLIGPYVQRRIKCLGDPRFRRVIIKLGEDFIKRYFEQKSRCPDCGMLKAFDPCRMDPFIFQGKITPSMDLSLQQLFQCPYQGELGVMFAESRALDVVCATLDTLAEKKCRDCRKAISAQDIERLRQARDLVLRDITKPPPSIFWLSRKVGLNESKLKRGFRALFGVTIHSCHRNARLDLACKIMLKGRHNVCQVAYEVGYSNPSHFSRAFYNRFKINPGAYLRDLRDKGCHTDFSDDQCFCNP